MKQKIWKLAGSITILVSILTALFPTVWSKAQPQVNIPAIDPTTAAHILEATVQITMVEHEIVGKEKDAPTTEGDGSWQKVSHYGRGVGTLVAIGDEVVLISHDHWSLFTSGTAPEQVLFHDAQGNLLHKMTGADLLPLILFHDSGTFILRAPAALTGRAVANAGDFETIRPGDIVHVVHHTSGQEDQLTLLAAEVVDYETYNGVPMLSLRTLNGGSIEPGDSGGGIWVNGQLAGNLWMTVRIVHQEWWRVTGPVRSETDQGLAAGLHSNLIDLVETLLQVEAQPEMIERDGLS